MKTLHEFLKEFAGKTSLQKDEHIKNRTGAEVQIVGELRSIAPDHLSCWNFDPEVSSFSYSIRIDHRGDQLRKQLLEYSSWDGVRMNTRFTGARFGDPDQFTFALVSIARLYTAEMKRQAAHKANLKKVPGWALLASAVWLVFGSGVGIGACYVLKWVFRVPLAVTLLPALVLAGLVSVGVGIAAAKSERP